MTGERPLALIVDETDLDLSPAEAVLRERGFDVGRCRLDLDPLVPGHLRGAVALIVGYTSIGASVLDQLPHLGAVATCSVGVDMVDPDAAAERGIGVIPIGAPSTEEVAVHALTLILAVERSLPEAIRVAREGGWTEDFAPVPRRFSDLTLGLLGFGRIAQRLAGLALPLFGRIITHDPYAQPRDGVEPVSSEELFARSDVLSVHLPLAADTRGLVGETELASVPAGMTLVNTGRGAVVDDRALLAALESGRVAGAGLDVLGGDPPDPDDPLLRHPRVIVTPHIGFLSDASLAAYRELPGRNIAEWWERREGRHD